MFMLFVIVFLAYFAYMHNIGRDTCPLPIIVIQYTCGLISGGYSVILDVSLHLLSHYKVKYYFLIHQTMRNILESLRTISMPVVTQVLMEK